MPELNIQLCQAFDHQSSHARQALEGQSANSATLFAQITLSHQLAAAARAILGSPHIAYTSILTLAVWAAVAAAAALLLWRRDGAAA